MYARIKIGIKFRDGPGHLRSHLDRDHGVDCSSGLHNIMDVTSFYLRGKMLRLSIPVLNLEKKVLFAEQVTIESGSRSRRIVVPFHQSLGDLALQTSRKPDQPLGMLRQKILAH